MIGFIRSADPQYSSAVINTNVIVSHTGEVVWLSHGIFRSSCDIDVEFFPFDEQRCVLKWASWTYDGYQVRSIFLLYTHLKIPLFVYKMIIVVNQKVKDGGNVRGGTCRKSRGYWAMGISRPRNSSDRKQFSAQLTRTVTGPCEMHEKPTRSFPVYFIRIDF